MHTAAMLPPDVPFPGLDPAWSRRVAAPDAEGITREWHVLDTHGADGAGDSYDVTLLCVHGNPTWSYLWRNVLAAASPGWRVLAVDQLGMGWSERLPHPRTLAQRVDDLTALTAALGITGPVVTLAHDWGGPVSLGWAARHRDQLTGVVLTNTAVHQPTTSRAPEAIRVARSRGVLDAVCRRSPAFVRATTALSLPPLSKPVRDAFAAPYATAARRGPVADFVRDIPLEPDHPSRATLDEIAAATAALESVPAFLVWGTRDPVFRPRYLEDLLRRLPHADVQIYPRASHLVLEDEPGGVDVIWKWLQGLRVHPERPGYVGSGHHPSGASPTSAAPGVAQARPETVAPVAIAVDGRRGEDPAVVELRSGRRITFSALANEVDEVARGLVLRGVRAGQRVAVLIPPGIELTTVAYALWRIGAVVTIADAGLGLRRLGAALRTAGPAHVIGIRPGLVLAAAQRVPGDRHLLRLETSDLDSLAGLGRASAIVLPDPEALSDDTDAAVLFTSGATGPPKGVVYTRRGLRAQVELLRATFGLGPQESFVAAFAPFALYGPALGMTSVVPDIDVTAPHTLTAAGLADAVDAVEASVVFAAPAALRTIAATAGALTPGQRDVLARPRLLLSAGAPVPVELLRELKTILPEAETQTPYGMTEAMPAATHDPVTAESASALASGVCVGPPVPGVQVGIAPLDDLGRPDEALSSEPGVSGEIVVNGPHIKDRYDRAWAAQRLSARPAGWHRTGDVGHLDHAGCLWVEGRLSHVIATETGVLTPYPIENRLRGLPGVADVAVVGVGPPGAGVVVVVVVPEERLGPVGRLRGAPRAARRLAPAELAEAVRRHAGVPVAAVLIRDWLPVDVRHASKVDRTALAQWAGDVLNGENLSSRLRHAVKDAAPRTKSR